MKDCLRATTVLLFQDCVQAQRVNTPQSRVGTKNESVADERLAHKGAMFLQAFTSHPCATPPLHPHTSTAVSPAKVLTDRSVATA